ncbi:hypothetical protein HBB16_09305 [Pseudonocardia sp. MCCB 268]|nr:hypothetical protein [Pseudonocardia cytotoxica]
MGTEFAFVAALTEAGPGVSDRAGQRGVVPGVAGRRVPLRRRPAGDPLPLLLAVLGLATLPAALAGSWWNLLLLLVPAGLAIARRWPPAARDPARPRPGPRAGHRPAGLGDDAQDRARRPAVHALVDAASPALAIVVCAAVATVVAGVAAVLMRRGPERTGTQPGA